MRVLLDTHLVIWAMVGSDKLSDKARSYLSSRDVIRYVSSVSIWETALKHSRKPDDIPVTGEQMMRFCRENQIRELPLRFEHIAGIGSLSNYHNDPFDRILIQQAIKEDLLLITHDEKILLYGDYCIGV